MDHRLSAFRALVREKAGNPDITSQLCTCQEACDLSHCLGLDLHLDIAGKTGFKLFRTVSDPEPQNRHAGGGVTQGVQFDHLSDQFQAIQKITRCRDGFSLFRQQPVLLQRPEPDSGTWTSLPSSSEKAW